VEATSQFDKKKAKKKHFNWQASETGSKVPERKMSNGKLADSF